MPPDPTYTPMMRSLILVLIATVSWTLGGTVHAKPPLIPPPTIEFLPDLVYSKQGDEELKLDLSIPKNLPTDGKVPTVILLHGGGWTKGNKADLHVIQFHLSNLGMVCASVQYRFAPKHRYPAQIEDVRNSLSWLREHADQYHIHPNKIAVIGASAGAHLAVLLAVQEETSSYLCAAVGIAGPYDLTRGYLNSDKQNPKEGEAVRYLLNNLLGGTPETKADLYQHASPITYVSKDRKLPAIQLIHGEQDTLVPIEQADWLSEKLKASGAEVDYLRIPDANHGGFGKDQNKHIQSMLGFLALQFQKVE